MVHGATVDDIRTVLEKISEYWNYKGEESMSLYKAENFEKVIKRIQGKIDALHIKPHFFEKGGKWM